MKKTLSSFSCFMTRHWSFFAFTALGIIAMMEPALAGGGVALDSVVSNVGQKATGIPKLISLAAYTLGTGTIVAGALKLKAHVDNPGQTGIGQGLGRLLIGGTLTAVPAVADQVNKTTGTSESESVQFNKVDTVSW